MKVALALILGQPRGGALGFDALNARFIAERSSQDGVSEEQCWQR
jgi:hypothetical protein